ncbi:hypothetical protein [Clostridium tarantellae]|uniref:Uncharacterized protein n=1 Tax=Clostridium tarantellae TaxID=39493 RepID=A0A6I1MW46_9CLOT|nr:hypothetical protein [Clostridium tarantellae]MPQ44399.1 hypothetical protein [Clostridium tarantellae]
MSKKKIYNKEKVSTILLALAIGIAGTSMSFAYFKDIELVKADISINFGNLDVEFGSKSEENKKVQLQIDGLLPGKTKVDTFNIDNIGTIDQILKFKFYNGVGMTPEELQNFTYNLVFKNISGENISKNYSGNLNELLNEEYKEIQNNDNNIILKSNERIIGEFSVTASDELNKSFEGKKINFSIDILSTQNDNIKWK